jgi:uncharacterized protein (DUF2235 family)
LFRDCSCIFLFYFEFVASVGVPQVVRLRQKLASAQTAIKSLFGQGEEQDEAVMKLEALKLRVQEVGASK